MGQGSSHRWFSGIVLLLGAALAIGMGPGLARAQGTAAHTGMHLSPTGKVTSAKLEFRQFCASCHGMDGKGDGPAVKGLSTKPANLTILTKAGGGVFPEKLVKDVITGGGTAIPAHGSPEMPVWGMIFRSRQKGLIGQPHFTHAEVEARINRLVNYIKSIQEK